MLLLALILSILASFGHADPIVKGKRVEKVKHPFLVHIRIVASENTSENREKRTIHSCGGTILTVKTILSAAHCMENSLTPPVGVVHAGEVYKTFFVKRGQRIRVVDYEIHPDYISKNIDLALMYLDQNLLLNQKIKVASFTNVEINENVFISGWGVKELNQPTRILRTTTLKVHMSEICQKYGHGTTNFLFLIDPNRLSTFCYGDSGGPVIYKNKVAGVMIESFKETVKKADGSDMIVCSAKNPAVAVNVVLQMDWITNYTK